MKNSTTATNKQGLRLTPPNVLFKTYLGVATVTATTLVSLGVLLPSSAQAISFVTSRNALGANDYYDWGTLGSSFTTVNNPSTVTSNLGNNATISQAGGSFLILQEGNSASGNFAPGDNLLWSQGANGPITIAFANPVFGAGAQIQANSYGSFTANLTAYDVSNNSLGTFNLPGLSNGNADNSAIFIGVADSTASIAKLTFSVPVAYSNPQDFVINRLSVAGATPVPWETDTLPVVGSTILFGLGLWSKRKFEKNKYSQGFNKELANNEF
jgi:hypothetical protein